MNYENAQLGYVSGDWHWDCDANRYAKVYLARITGTWNGWAVPSFDRETAQRVTDDQLELIADDGEQGIYMESFQWDGDTLKTIPALQWYLPNEDTPAAMEKARAEAEAESWTSDGPFYAIGDGWTWVRCNADGTPFTGNDTAQPTEAQSAAFNEYNERALFTGKPLFSGNREVRADGSHAFPLSIWTGEKVPDQPGLHKSVQVATVVIARDGTIKVETA